MFEAVLEMGHVDVIEEEPKNMRDHLAMLRHGHAVSIGNPEDPFILRAGTPSRLIARYYIVGDPECPVRVSGSVEFMETLARIQEQWRSELH
jgi:hypothetical protein